MFYFVKFDLKFPLDKLFSNWNLKYLGQLDSLSEEIEWKHIEHLNDITLIKISLITGVFQRLFPDGNEGAVGPYPMWNISATFKGLERDFHWFTKDSKFHLHLMEHYNIITLEH